MNKYLIMLGLSLIFTPMVSAHGVTIKKAEKVIIKPGISKEDLVHKMKCMIILKDIKEGKITKKEVFAEKMEKIHNICAKKSLPKEKCHKFAKRVAKFLHACFVKARFMEEFFGIHNESPAHAQAEESPVHEHEAEVHSAE
jgi:hypothetical protein